MAGPAGGPCDHPRCTGEVALRRLFPRRHGAALARALARREVRPGAVGYTSGVMVEPSNTTLLAGSPLPLALLSPSDEVVQSSPGWRTALPASGPLLVGLDPADEVAARSGLARARQTAAPATFLLRVAGVRFEATAWPADDAGALWIGARALPPAASGVDALVDLARGGEGLLLELDADARVLAALGPGLRDFLPAPEAALGQRLTDLLPADCELVTRFRRCLAGERLRLDGVHRQTHWLQLYHPRRDAAGAVVGAVLIALDVTRDLAAVRQAELLHELVNNVPTNVYAVDARGICQISEGGLLASAGLRPGQLVGVDAIAAYTDLPQVHESMRAAFAGRTTTVEFPVGDRLYSQVTLPWRDLVGEPVGAFCIASDITERRRDEDLLREQVRIIQAQKQAISALSSPIIDVREDVLAVPLVGSIDDERAAAIMSGLLAAIARKRARLAILDLTGVEAIDPGSAAHLVRIVRAVELLGCGAIVTGIRAAIAQTMAGLGLDLSSVLTLRSLQEALLHCPDRPR